MSILVMPKIDPDVAVTKPPAPEVASAIKAALGAVNLKASIQFEDNGRIVVFFKQDQTSGVQYIDRVRLFKLPRIQRALDGWQVELDDWYWTWWGMNMLRLVITR